ncbi:MAG: hypothetical protein ACKVS8_05390 [Phycisphaerales bacterium]
MMNSKALRIGAMIAVPAVCAASAAAEVALSFGYNDLSGSYTSTSATSGSFSAAASDTLNLQSSGDVTRLIPTTGTAEFAPGFVSSTLADFVINLSVTNINVIPGIADGAGTFVLTDVDGDTLTGDIVGVWIAGGLDQTFFNGSLFNVVFNNNSSDGGIDGTSGDHVDGNLGFPFIYEGALTQLFLNPGSPFFFDSDFSEVDTQVLAEILPTPGAATLAGMAGLMVARRRRR